MTLWYHIYIKNETGFPPFPAPKFFVMERNYTMDHIYPGVIEPVQQVIENLLTIPAKCGIAAKSAKKGKRLLPQEETVPKQDPIAASENNVMYDSVMYDNVKYDSIKTDNTMQNHDTVINDDIRDPKTTRKRAEHTPLFFLCEKEEQLKSMEKALASFERTLSERSRTLHEKEQSLSERWDAGRIHYIPVGSILPNPYQPRRTFEELSLYSLAESIRRHGILQPLTVRRLKPSVTTPKLDTESDTAAPAVSPAEYELIAGERRLRAACAVHMECVPCIVLEADNQRAAELALIENLQRENLSMFEQAGAIASLIDIHAMTQEQIAKSLSCSQSAVANKLRILRLTEAERDIILKNHLTERHARAFLRIKELPLRKSTVEYTAAHHLNVAQTERYIDRMLTKDSIEDSCTEEPKQAVPTVQTAPIQTIQDTKISPLQTPSEQVPAAHVQTAPAQSTHPECAEDNTAAPASNTDTAAPVSETQTKQTRKLIVKDFRVFFNTVNNAVRMMQEAGIPIEEDRVETDNEIRMILVLPRIPMHNTTAQDTASESALQTAALCKEAGTDHSNP